jgi:hypothetical protein
VQYHADNSRLKNQGMNWQRLTRLEGNSAGGGPSWRHADGGLTIYIQATSPGQDKETNWLPSSKSGPMFVIVKTRMPDKGIAEQKWRLPAWST